MPRIALIHATRVAIAPIEAAAARLWPEAETISILDESLSVDRQKTVDLSRRLLLRILRLARHAEDADADGILFTCSAFGEAIEEAAERTSVPVMKPNEAMFNDALQYGNRIAMITTFPPAAASMAKEFRDVAKARCSSAVLSTHFCRGALDAKRAGKDTEHDRLIADTAREITDADVILLGQFSMAGAIDAVRKSTSVPVLTSPDAAIDAMRRRVLGDGQSQTVFARASATTQRRR
ncbi:MAG: aspartate/glutamate racemase family protein [Pseudomonadota bacterium]